MKKFKKQKMTRKTALAVSCLSMVLWGCADENKTKELVIEPIVSEEDMQAASGEELQSLPEADTQTVSDDIQITSEKDTLTGLDDASENDSDAKSLYEQFLNNSIPATVDSAYSEGDYDAQIITKNAALTLTELGDCVSKYFFDPEYTDKTSCDQIQYAYTGCPDSSDENARHLLIKFIGLNIYAQDDDSYAVFILTENDGQLYITDSYQCWARSETVAYENGVLWNYGSSGAGDHESDQSVILSDGKQTAIYKTNILSGWWTNAVNGSLYTEVFGDNTEPNLVVSIYTIGSEKYYQYDMTYCEKEEIPLCEEYINRCRDEAAINWVSEEEVQTAIQNRCTAVGIDYSIIDTQEEAVWNDLP